MTMTAVAETAALPAPAARSSRRRLWFVASALVVVVAVAATITTVWVRHWSAAPSLRFDGGEQSWVGVDGATSKDVRIGAFDVLEAQARPRHSQAFEFWVHNPSSVTQTVEGLAYSTANTDEPSHILLSTTDPNLLRGDEQPRFTSTPEAVPPHQWRIVRYVLRVTDCWPPEKSETFTDVSLRVKVGTFTRTEDIALDRDSGFVLTSEHEIC